MDKIDAVLMAGTHKNPRRWIYGKNKAFLPIKGKAMVKHVAENLLACPEIKDVIVVGPRRELEEIFSGEMKDARLKIIQQRSRMLENVWTGFCSTFADGNNLPGNKEIEMQLLAGHLPIRTKAHLRILTSVFAAVARRMVEEQTRKLRRKTVTAIMDRRFDEIRRRHERAEWFMGRIGIDTILREGHILQETSGGVCFTRPRFYDFFLEWERRLNKQIFVTACDVPLLVPEAVSDFITQTRSFNADFHFAVSTREMLECYYTTKNNKPGIVRPYLDLREAEIRATNMILVKPNWIGNKELIQEGFGVRKMTEWRNIIAVIAKLLKQKGRFRAVRLAVLMQAEAVLKRNGYRKSSELFRRFIRGEELENVLSRLFMTRFNMVVSPYGGVSLDVDCESDYEVLKENVDFWLDIQAGKVKELENRNIQLFRF